MTLAPKTAVNYNINSSISHWHNWKPSPPYCQSFLSYDIIYCFWAVFQNSETFSFPIFPILRPCKLQHEFNIWLSINTIEKAPLPHTMHPSHNSTCLLPTPRCVPELQASSLHKDAKFEAFIFIYKVSVWVSPPHHHTV